MVAGFITVYNETPLGYALAIRKLLLPDDTLWKQGYKARALFLILATVSLCLSMGPTIILVLCLLCGTGPRSIYFLVLFQS